MSQQTLVLQHPLLELLKVQPMSIEELVEMSELPLQEVLCLLTEFELEGHVIREGGFILYCL